MYVMCDFGYGAKFDATERAIIDATSLTPVKWGESKEGEDLRQLEYKCRPVLPIELAEVISLSCEDKCFNVHRVYPKGFEEFVNEAKKVRAKLAWNDKTNAPVVDNPLLGVKEVQVIEDCCTNDLQSKLDAGWSILAVCPQPQRRPDYVLGRGQGALPLPIIEPKSSALPLPPDDDIPF